ncbi:HAMP domain-containing histidine kinase [Alkalicella caledoniensis]|uniref:histidine kinase n=1 Tax=Alkalicella caledoniensis TaxID=2731377 RepID=A0A7G9W577_ALKCA|nr:HAMP domain-containing sensor histidine kinase [Alkalicella caledoniensis]QNO13839.1 HAMP domain-containing histidine kinase [Alkalicella caledoniensis]
MFKRSFFSKLIVIYAGILTLILMLMSGFLNYAFQRFYYIDEFRRLENTAIEFADVYEQYNIGQLGILEFQVSVRTFTRSTNSVVLVVAPDGKIVFNSNSLVSGIAPHMGRLSSLDESLKPQLNRSLKDQTVREVWRSNITGESALNLFLPLKYNDEVVGAMVVSQPSHDINQVVSSINKLIWFVGAIGSIITVFILYFVSKNFTRPITKINKAALSMASGTFIKVYLDNEDELGQLASSFNYMGEQLAKQEEHRREFLTTVSHELRTPLTSILGFIQGMLDGVIEKDEQDHYLKITVKEIKRIISLTNDLLDLERIKQGQVELHKDYFSVVDLIKECLSQLNPLFKERSIGFEIDCPNELVIVGDRNRLKQVFMNLLDNGIRHANTKIDVEIRYCGRDVQIEISDDGPGISPEDAPHLFERFYKADKSRTSKGSGAGLGLSIAKHLVVLHGGSLKLEPSDSGAIFKVTLNK